MWTMAWILDKVYCRALAQDPGIVIIIGVPGEALASWIVSQAGSVEVVEPSILREGVAQRARTLLEAQRD